MKKRQSSPYGKKRITLLLSLIFLLTLAVGSSVAYFFTHSDTLVNTFISGVLLKRNVTISKTVEWNKDILGDDYQLNPDKQFEFSVDLGDGYVDRDVTLFGKDFEVKDAESLNIHQDSEGNTVLHLTDGKLTLLLKNGGYVTFLKLDLGTNVQVSENLDGILGEGYTLKEAPTMPCVVGQDNTFLKYVNYYSPGKVYPVNLTVNGTKHLVNRDWQVGDQITFQLEYKAPNSSNWVQLPEGTQTITYRLAEYYNEETGETTWIPEPGCTDFDFNKAIQNVSFDVAGTYAFRISEVDSNIEGVTYNDTRMYFDVLIGDADSDGKLEIQSVTGSQSVETFWLEPTTEAQTEAVETHYWTVTGSNAPDVDGNFTVDAEMWNHYAPEGVDAVYIEIDKSLEDLSGTNRTPAGFTFELYDYRTGELVTTSHPTTAAGETRIKLIVDAGGDDYYILKETHSGETISGMTYDDSVYRVGVFKEIVATNTYSGSIVGMEENDFILLGGFPKESEEDEEADEDSTESTETTPEETTATDPINPEDTTHTDPEEPIIARPAGSSGTQETEPEETTQTEPETEDSSEETTEEKTPSSASAVLTILSQTISAEEEYEATHFFKVGFTNVYDPTDVTVDISGQKTVAYRKTDGTEIEYWGNMEGKFTFCLYQIDESDFEIPNAASVLATAANRFDGSFDFYSVARLDRVGTYYFLVHEFIPEENNRLPGVTYDDTVYLVTVNVTLDEATGSLVPHYSYQTEAGAVESIAFRNTYALTKASVPISGTKLLDDASYTGTEFTFNLYKTDARYERGDAVKSTSVVTDGNFKWEISYSPEDVENSGGKADFYYRIEEVAGDTSKYEFSQAVYTVHDVVTDDGCGGLYVERTIVFMEGITSEMVGEIVFANTTKEEPTTKPTEKPTDPSSEPTTEPTTEPSTDSTTESTTEATKKPTKPGGSNSQTGDTSNVWLYVALLAGSGFVLLLIAALRRKPKKHGKYE